MNKILESLIKSTLDKNAASGGESSIVAMHCQQMREYGIRGGNIEFFPMQDNENGDRKKFISDIWHHNQLALSLNHIMDTFVCRGEILWFVLPDPEMPNNYYIDFFHGGINDPEPEFKVYYAPGGRKIDKAVIVYSYEIEQVGALPLTRWVQLTATSETIEMRESHVKPEIAAAGQTERTDLFSNPNMSNALMPSGTAYPLSLDFMQRTGKQNLQNFSYPNPFKPYIPVVLSKNNGRRSGQRGASDFAPVAGQIEAHELMLRKIRENLELFAGPSLVTTRSATEVLETATKSAIATWASQNRYVDMYGGNTSGSTNPIDAPPGVGATPGGFLPLDAKYNRQIAKIIGNVQDRERFGYIQPNPVTGDMSQYANQYRENIHWTLGGLDPLGLRSGATFGEIRSLFGRIQNTAEQKANGLLTYGLQKVFELCIAHQEILFKEWLFKELTTGTNAQLFPTLLNPEQLDDATAIEIYKIGTQPPEPVENKEKNGRGRPKKETLPEPFINFSSPPSGMVPGGDRSCSWRYTREVYQLTTQERLQLSIAARNEREDGLSQEWVLRRQYPDLTDEEIQNAMSGFSPRVVNNATGAVISLIQMYQQMLQMAQVGLQPDLFGQITIKLGEMIGEAMLTLDKELSYGRPKFKNAEPIVNRYNLEDLIGMMQQNESSIDNGILRDGTSIAPPAPGSSVSGQSPTNGSTSSANGSYPIQPNRDGIFG
jgi:hypothetical protein